MNSHLISRCLVSTGIVLAAASLAFGTTYYVDSSGGNDGNNGTSQTTPWQSLGKVNGTTFVAGDQILFLSGDVWTGALTPKGSGSAGNPITIGDYGSGALPLIQGNGVSATLSLSGLQYWDVANLELTNHAATAGVRRGIDISSSNHIHVMNCTVDNMTGTVGQDNTAKSTAGVHLEGAAATDILIDGCIIHDVSNEGISTTGGPYSNLTISNNTIYNVTKNAMSLGFTNNTDVVEYNICHDTARSVSGNTMYNFNSSGTVFQHNEGYRNITPIDQDGDMYDADLGCSNAIFQYSYSHDNHFGLLMFDTGGSGGEVVRYNISQNDLGASGARGAIIYFNYALSSSSVYNNVIYVGAGTHPTILEDNGANHHTYSFSNNIIYNASTTAKYSLNAGDAATYTHNLFFGNHPGGEPADAFKLTSDPMFVSPGSGSFGINSVTGYQLKPGSPAIGSGILISNNGGQDFWGDPVSATAAPNRGAYSGSGVGSGSVAAPVFSPAPGTFSAPTSVSMSTTTASASIYYTADGSTPTTSSTKYTGPVVISTTTTLKAIANDGTSSSSETDGTYTITSPPPPPAAPSFSPAPGTYSSTQSVTISDTTVGASIFYTTDGSTPTTSSTKYTGPVAIATTTTLKAIANDSGGTSPETDGTYTITSPPPMITLQASKLAPTGSGAAISTATDAKAPGGTWVKIASTAVGQWIQFTTTSIPAGTYSLSFIYRTNTDRAQHNVTIDGTQVGTTIVDQYAPGATATYPPAVTIGSVTFGTAGTHTIRLTATGKNAASTSYQISAVQFIFQ